MSKTEKGMTTWQIVMFVGITIHYVTAALGGPPVLGTHNAGWMHWVVIHIGAIVGAYAARTR